MTTKPTPLTRQQLTDTPPADRLAKVEEYALALLASLREPGARPLDATSRLADAGVDSIQVVELKFSLDELLGYESDVERYISNPSIRQLAEHIVREADS